MALTAIGIVMVYSASSVRSYISRADPAAQGLEQLVWAGIGLVGLVVAMRIDFRHLRYLAIPIYVITLVLLVVVLVPGIGAEINGSRRWIVIPGVGTLQPAEFAKLAVVLYLAHWLDRRGKAAGTFWNGLVPFALLVAPGFFLIAAEPDLGTAGVYVVVAVSIFFMAGANVLYLGAIFSAVVGCGLADDRRDELPARADPDLPRSRSATRSAVATTRSRRCWRSGWAGSPASASARAARSSSTCRPRRRTSSSRSSARSGASSAR